MNTREMIFSILNKEAVLLIPTKCEVLAITTDRDQSFQSNNQKRVLGKRSFKPPGMVPKKIMKLSPKTPKKLNDIDTEVEKYRSQLIEGFERLFRNLKEGGGQQITRNDLRIQLGFESEFLPFDESADEFMSV